MQGSTCSTIALDPEGCFVVKFCESFLCVVSEYFISISRVIFLILVIAPFPLNKHCSLTYSHLFIGACLFK